MQNAETFCFRLYNTNYMPIHYYKNNELTLSLPAFTSGFNPTPVFWDSLRQEQVTPCYLITKSFHYYGLVKNHVKNIEILVGPVITIPINRKELSQIREEVCISSIYDEELWHYFHGLQCFSFHQFLNQLLLLHYELNDENLSVENIMLQTENSSMPSIDNKYTLNVYDAREQKNHHNTYYFEREYYGYIRDGNIDGLKSMDSRSLLLNAGVLSDNSLRQEKNIFIGNITQVSRCSIEGGLDIETAYWLADIYIQEMEKMQNMEDIRNLRAVVNLDYAKRVAECKMPKDLSPDIWQCLQYIGNHVNQPLTVEIIADALGRNRSSLSRKFKTELGFNLSDFILRRKLEEAKSLLAFTDKSISEISNYLYFSSQSHLQTAFKKKFGVTPKIFRRQHH